jgi:hypothetical protein
MVDCQWPDDDLVDIKIDELIAEIRELLLHAMPGNVPEILADDPGFEVHLNHIRTRLAVDAYALVTLSPPEIWESYHSIAVASGGHYVEEVNRATGAIKDSVADWEGPAAQAFSLHVTDLSSFMSLQTTYVNEVLQHLAAAYKLAIQVREDYKNIVDVWIQASREFRRKSSESRLSTTLKVGAGVVASVVAAVLEPEVAAAALAGGATAIGGVVEGYTANLGGTHAQDIIDSYQRTYDTLQQSYEDELDRLRSSVVDRQSRLADEQPHLFEPLPGVCDIDGPDFRYENFFHDFTPPNGFDSKVDAERKKYVAEKSRARDGSIGRVLGGVGNG